MAAGIDVTTQAQAETGPQNPGAAVRATDDFQRRLGRRLRQVRKEAGMSLSGVTRKSGGQWKAARLSSYERGDRAITATDLCELADLYGVPVGALIPGSRHRVADGDDGPSIDIDLNALATLTAKQAGPLVRYAVAVRLAKIDSRYEVLCIGPRTLRLLATIYNTTPADMAAKLVEWRVVAEPAASTDPRPKARKVALA